MQDDNQLLQSARTAANQAYAPYSQFPVGVALETEDGTIITGVNVENASYPLSLCAERNAVATAVALGHRRFRRIAVVGPGPDVITPCGGCRQVLAEFGDFVVIMAEASGRTAARRMRVSELLPMAFSAEDLDGV